MISLEKTGNAIKFTFDNNGHYLQDGTIEVPVNSLTLVTDDSDMFTFNKSATNDIFVSGLYSEIGMTKSELETFYKNNMVGGAITIDSEITSSSTNAVQSSAIFDKVTINVEESGSTSGTAFAGVYSFNYSDGVYYFNAGSKDREDSCNLSEIKYKSGADGEEKTISSTGETDDYIYSSNFYSGTITMKGNNHLTNVNVQGDGRGYSYRYYYNSLVPQWLNDYVAELETRIKALEEQNNT